MKQVFRLLQVAIKKKISQKDRRVGLALNVLGSRWWLQIQETAEALGRVAATIQTTFPYLNEPLPKARKKDPLPSTLLPFLITAENTLSELMATSSGSRCSTVQLK